MLKASRWRRGWRALDHLTVLRETLEAYRDGVQQGGGQDFSAVTHVVEQRLGRKISRQ